MKNLPDDIRMKLQLDFDKIYDNSGSREDKFFKWMKSFNSAKNGNTEDDFECSDGKFSVNLKNKKDGRIYYREF